MLVRWTPAQWMLLPAMCTVLAFDAPGVFIVGVALPSIGSVSHHEEPSLGTAQHASAHFHATGQPIIQTFEPGEV